MKLPNTTDLLEVPTYLKNREFMCIVLVDEWFEEIRNSQNTSNSWKLPESAGLQVVQTVLNIFETHQIHLKLPNSADLLVI